MRAELAHKYLAAHGMVATKGAHITQVFLPYIIMDTARELFDRSIRPLPLRHKAAKCRNEMRAVYHEFCKDFFRPFTADEQDEIIESFDGFEAFIANELTFARVAVSNAVDFLDFDLQMTMTDIFLTQIVAECAGIIYYDAMNSRLPENYKHNAYIDRYERLAVMLGREYYKSTGNTRTIDNNDIPDVNRALERLAKRMTEYNQLI